MKLNLLIILLFIYPKIFLSEGLLNCDILEDKHEQVKIQIIPEIELFQIVCYLTKQYSSTNSLKFRYKRDIKKYFQEFKNHSTILFFRDTFKHHYSPALIKSYFLNNQYEDDTLMVNLIHFDKEVDNYYKNKLNIIDSLRIAFKDFASETKFSEFYKSNKPYYLEKIRKVKSSLFGKSIVNERETFWGDKKDIYCIIITLLERDFHSCWFENNGLLHCIFFLSPRFQINDDVEFGNSNISNLKEGKFSAADMIFAGSGHEFGHSFLNPITLKYKNEIENINFEYLSSKHPTKLDFLNESILRSYTAYEFIRDGETEIGNQIIQSEIKNGFIYNDKIEKLLEYYETQRNLFPTFEKFIPHMINELTLYIENQ